MRRMDPALQLRVALVLVWTALVALAPAGAAGAAPGNGGRARTEALIAAFSQVKTTVGGKLDPAFAADNARAFATLDGYFDLEALTRAVIQPQAAKLKPAELTTFSTKFKGLLRTAAYSSSGDLFRRAKLSWPAPETVSGERIGVPVKLRLDEQDTEMKVDFVWGRGPAGLRLVDVLFDGDSLVKDYQNQIARLLEKSGVPGLFGALDARQAEIEAGR